MAPRVRAAQESPKLHRGRSAAATEAESGARVARACVVTQTTACVSLPHAAACHLASQFTTVCPWPSTQEEEDSSRECGSAEHGRAATTREPVLCSQSRSMQCEQPTRMRRVAR